MTDTKERELLREIVAYCKEHGHDWSNIAEAESLLTRPVQPCHVPAGYVLVPVEPAGWQFYDRENSRWCNGDDRIKDYRKNTEAAGYPVRDVYAALTHPATGEGEAITDTDLLVWLIEEEAIVRSFSTQAGLRYRVEWPDTAEFQTKAYANPRDAISDAMRASKGEGNG